MLSLYGTAPVATAFTSGLSIPVGSSMVGTAGGDPAAFINKNLVATGTHLCISGQTYTFTSRVIINVNNFVIQGMGMNQTIIDSSSVTASVGSQGTFTLGLAGNTLSNIFIQDLTIINKYDAANQIFGIVNNNPVNYVWVERVRTINGYNGGISFNSGGVARASSYITVRDTVSMQEGLAVQFYDIDYGLMDHNIAIGTRDDPFAELTTIANGSRGVRIQNCFGDWSGTVRSPVVASLVKLDGSSFAGSISDVSVEGCSGRNAPTGINSPNNGLTNFVLSRNRFIGGALSNRGISVIGTNGRIDSNDSSGMGTADIYLDNSGSNIANITITNNRLASATPIIFGTSVGSGVIATGNSGYNPQATRSVTAGASIYTYTNNDGYPEQIVLTTLGGISAYTCLGAAQAQTLGVPSPTLMPSKTCVFTWATTAPVFQVDPL
jgi:hypothetical protein